MPFLHRSPTISLYYEVHGPPTSTPLLLTHGYSSTSAMWQPQIASFSQHYRLILWDMRGHGQTSYPSDPSAYSEEHTIADMAALLDHICGPQSQAIVGGLSLGGYMSLAFYRVFPERVMRLLIIDTGPGFKKDSAREAWNQTAYKTAEGFEKNGLKQLSGLSPERSTVRHRDAKGLALAARGMLTQRNDAVITSLERVQVPSLIVVGEDDRPFLAAAEYMSRKIRGAKKVVVPRAGHAVNIDQPGVFNEAVLKFLKGSDGTARL